MKRTLSGKLQPTTPPVITGTDMQESLAEDPQAPGDVAPPGTPVMRTPEADDGTQADWQAATWLHDDLLDELPDADTLLQMMPHTPPVERPRSPEASTGDVQDVQNEEAGSEDTANDSYYFDKEFAALLDASLHPEAFSIDNSDIPTPTPEQWQSLAQALGKNRVTTYLALFSVTCNGVLAAVAEGMKTNTVISTLNLSLSCTAGEGALLATILKSNRHLENLFIQDCELLTAEDYLAVFAALPGNATLKELDAVRTGKANTLHIGKELAAYLAANHTLESISLPWSELSPEGLKAVAELLRVHPSLVGLGLGTMPTDEARVSALTLLLANNSRITNIRVDLQCFMPQVDWDGGEQLRKERLAHTLGSIGQCSGLTSITLDNFYDMDCLVEFLKRHPQLTAVNLFDEYSDYGDHAVQALEKLLKFAKQCSQLTAVSFRRHRELTSEERKCLAKLKQQTRVNRIRQHNEGLLPAAGAGMSVMLGVQRNEPQALPELPVEVTMQLAEAAVQYLRPADTRAVFGVVAPYGEAPQAAIEKTV